MFIPNFQYKKSKARCSFILSFFGAASVLLISCNDKKKDRNVERSFYFWKSVFKITDYEMQKLDSLQVKTLYVKFFDVDWDEQTKAPVPVAKLQVTSYTLQGGIQIIPTVFITNACIQKIVSSDIGNLADNLMRLIKTIQSVS